MFRKCQVFFVKDMPQASVIVRNGFSENAEQIMPDSEGNYYLRKGIYSYDVVGENLCGIHKVFTISRAELGQKKEIIVPIIPLEGKEAEYKGPIYLYSDELEEKLYGLDNLKEVDHEIFDTPAFDASKQINQFTTNEERITYLRAAVKGCSYARMEEEKYPFPVILYSEEISTMEKNTDTLLDLMKNSGKLNLFYHAQIHGIEMPSGECAMILAKKLAGKMGRELLKKMNIVLVPCINQKGSSAVTRECEGIDLNRDFIRTSTEEIQELHRLFYQFSPHVVIDGHTWTRANLFEKNDMRRTLFDARISAANTLNMDSRITKVNEEMVLYAQDACKKMGFRTGYYGASVNRASSKTYYSLSPCYVIIFESEGTRSAKYHFKRNVWAQYIGITNILKYVDNNCDTMLSEIEKIRMEFCQGLLPREGRFVIKQKRSGRNKYVSYIDNYNFWGKMIRKNAKEYHYRYDIPVKTMKIPDAYVIECSSIEEKWIHFFRKVHGIQCEKVELEEDIFVKSLEKGRVHTIKKGTRVYWFDKKQLQAQVMTAVFTDKYRGFEVNEDCIYTYEEKK